MPDYPFGHTYVTGDEYLSPMAWRPLVARMNKVRRALWLLPLRADDALDADYSVPGMSALTPAVAESRRYTPVYPATVSSTSPLQVTFDQVDVPTSVLDPVPGSPVPIDATPHDIDFSPGLGDPVLSTADGTVYPADFALPWSWPQLQYDIDEMLSQWIDPVAFAMDGETDPDAIGARLSDRTAFPGISGWTRKREREILSLADAGTDGWRARFVWTDGTSSPGERQYSTKIMLRAASVWTVDPDQATEPDVLTSYGRVEPGDLVGPWILNDITDALAEMTMTVGAMPSISGGGGYLYSGEQSSFATDSSIAAAKAAAEAGFAGSVGVRTYQQVSLMLLQEYAVTDLGGGDYQAGIYQRVGQPVALRVPNHATRTFRFFVYAISAAGDFDDNGTGLIENQFKEVGSAGPTTAATPVLGSDLGDETRVPDGPAGVGVRGVAIYAIFTAVEWDFS